MTFANFIFVVFLLVSLLVFVVLVLLMRQIKKDGKLPADKLTTLAAVLFLPTIIIFALIFKGISDWRSDIRFEKNRVEVEQFVKSAYEPLAESERSLLILLGKMQSLLGETEELELIFPSHSKLIKQVNQQWRSSQSNLYKIFEDSDREIRRAWISHRTMDSSDVLAKFSKQAVQLDSNIRGAMQKNQAQLHGAKDDLVKSLDDARRLLAAIRKPTKSKKQKAKNLETLQSIRPFNDRTKAKLVDFLGRIDKRLQDEVEALQELIRLSGQQMAKVRSYLFNNQDLEQPLAKVIADWKVLEQSSTAHLNQILFAAEAEYIALKLGLPQSNPAVKAMHKSLQLGLPHIVGMAIKKKNSINQSYNFKEGLIKR